MTHLRYTGLMPDRLHRSDIWLHSTQRLFDGAYRTSHVTSHVL